MVDRSLFARVWFTSLLVDLGLDGLNTHRPDLLPAMEER